MRVNHHFYNSKFNKKLNKRALKSICVKKYTKDLLVVVCFIVDDFNKPK